jgi:hypothetical protein
LRAAVLRRVPELRACRSSANVDQCSHKGMIRKSGKRFSEKIMLKQKDEASMIQLGWIMLPGENKK